MIWQRVILLVSAIAAVVLAGVLMDPGAREAVIVTVVALAREIDHRITEEVASGQTEDR